MNTINSTKLLSNSIQSYMEMTKKNENALKYKKKSLKCKQNAKLKLLFNSLVYEMNFVLRKKCFRTFSKIRFPFKSVP
jgi:hypothetical protein